MNKILQRDFDLAVNELKGFLLSMASICMRKGWGYELTDNAPESYEDLKKQSKNKVIPIASYGSDRTIYGDKSMNTLFRFYHDVIHLENGFSFSEKGETLTAKQHLKDATLYRLSPLACSILWADTYGQVRYYFTHRQFVNNQLDFVWNCIQHGIQKAIRVKL